MYKDKNNKFKLPILFLMSFTVLISIFVFGNWDKIHTAAVEDSFVLTPKIKTAFIDDMKTISVSTNKSFEVLNDNIEGFSIYNDEGEMVSVKSVNIKNIDENNQSTTAVITLSKPLDLKKIYAINKENYESLNAEPLNVFSSSEFEKLYTYNGNDLGVTLKKKKTSFRLWAPLSKKVRVCLYTNGETNKLLDEIQMTEAENGTWICTINKNLSNIYYTYKVTNGNNTIETVDPYAKAVGINGNRGMVINLSTTNPLKWKIDKSPKLINQTDAIIYELHIRDLSTDEDSGIINKGKFLGLSETGTKSPQGKKTGLEHIKDLGVTHIHLLPLFDFASIDETSLEENNFNWGYDPKNYNVPEGSYSTNPYNGKIRIEEFKKMVQTLHENNLALIMDVVYNHTYLSENSHLNKIVPGYYYRKTSDGGFSNASGCGNETASERTMVRKMIVDSVKYWVKEYHIDGFRFDLMGIHDIETMNIIKKELTKINPDIILYGEGWTAGNCPLDESLRAVKVNTNKLDNIAVFSDDLRDGIKGHVFTPESPGFVNGLDNLERTIMFGVTASTYHNQMDGFYTEVNYSDFPWANNPTQTVSYYEAHDNLTLWDKLSITNSESTELEKIQMQKLAAGIMFTSQGISFLHAGSEFLRTKYGNDNSYKLSDKINQLDWSRKSDHIDVYKYYKGLIKLRKSHSAFRIPTANELNKNLVFIENTDKNVVGFILKDNANNDSWNEILVIYNAKDEDTKITLPKNKNKWGIVVNKETAGTNILETINDNEINIEKKSLIVATNTLCK